MRLTGSMESNEYDGAFKKKEPVRAPRRRQPVPDEDEESVRRAAASPHPHPPP